jgi:hypothetical protein
LVLVLGDQNRVSHGNRMAIPTRTRPQRTRVGRLASPFRGLGRPLGLGQPFVGKMLAHRGLGPPHHRVA